MIYNTFYFYFNQRFYENLVECDEIVKFAINDNVIEKKVIVFLQKN